MSPNTATIVPEILFIQTIVFWLTRSRSRLTPKLSNSHQLAEPAKTPATKTSGELLPWTGIAENMAIKAIIVAGFVMVKNRVEKYAPSSPLPVARAASVAGLEINVRIPR